MINHRKNLKSFPVIPHHMKAIGMVIAIAIMLTACSGVSPTNTESPTWDTPLSSPPVQSSTETSRVPTGIAQPLMPTLVPSESPPSQRVTPTVESTEESKLPANFDNPSNQLAYLSEGDLWIVDITKDEPVRVTSSGDILSFAWAPDGSRIASYHGGMLCQIVIEGTDPPCIELGLNEQQASILRSIAWSPDLREITLWNPINPWDETAIGWVIVPLEGDEEIIFIQDPVDFGATLTPENEPGGVTGQALYLPDGTLIGTMTHFWLCGESACHYQLFYYDQKEKLLKPYDNKPEEGFSEGMGLVFSPSTHQIYNFGTFHTGCEAFITFVDAFDLETATRETLNLAQMAVNAVAISPDGSRAVIAHNAGCSTQNEDEWAQSCGLAQAFDVYPMQLFDLVGKKQSGLPAGLHPGWSSDGSYIAFRSCLENQRNDWETNPNGSPGIYVLELETKTINFIAAGDMLQWRP